MSTTDEAREIVLPSPCLVVLVGPSGSGKTTWADEQFGRDRVVSSDRLRAVVGEGEHDLSASADAFELLEIIVRRRLSRRLTTVVDSLGLDSGLRSRLREMAARAGLPCIAVSFDTPPAECRRRNQQRRPGVPANVLRAQFQTFAQTDGGLTEEGFAAVHRPGSARLVPAALSATSDRVAVQEQAPVALRFGLQIPSFTWPGGAAETGARLRAIAAAAEDAGFSSLWVMDHFRQIPQVGPAWHDMLESYTTMGFLAAATQHARIGVLVSGITYRNIAHLGKIVATLDVLSGGRAMCGLGAAWFAAEHKAYGWPFPPLRERYALLEDALQLLPVLWGPGTPPFKGRVIEVSETMCYPRPLQERIPILVGGSGERTTLRLVAKHADAANLFGEHDVVRHKVEVLHRHCATFDRDPTEIDVTHLSQVLVGRSPAEVNQLVDERKGSNQSAERFAASVNAGTISDHIGRFRALADAGVSTAIVSLNDLGDTTPLERFAPIIDAFRIGTA